MKIHYHPVIGVRLNIDELLSVNDKIMWVQSLINELGRLSQDIESTEGTNNICFIKKREVPHRKISYTQKLYVI